MKIVAVLRGPDDLHKALRARVEALNVSRDELDGLQRCARGYSAKQLSPRPQKRLTVDSQFTLINAVGCYLAMIEDAELMRMVADRTTPRNADKAKHAVAVHFMVSKRFMRAIAKKGGKLSRSKVTKRYATKIAKRAARARWHGVTKQPQYRKAKATPAHVGKPDPDPAPN